MIESYSQQVKLQGAAAAVPQRRQAGCENVSAAGGPGVRRRRFPARGLAVGDFDNDGRLDVLIGNNGGAPVLLRNNAGERQPLGRPAAAGRRTATATRSARRITWSAGGQTRSRLKASGGSYLSSHDPREVLGLGPRAKIDWIEIKWPQPSGRVERFTDVPIDRYVTIVEGKGIVERLNLSLDSSDAVYLSTRARVSRAGSIDICTFVREFSSRRGRRGTSLWRG